MRASTPRIESRSEGTLDCHTDAILLREGAVALGSAYLRGSSSASMSVGTPTTMSEPPPFALPRSTFPAAKVTFVVEARPATVRAPRELVPRSRAAGRAAAVVPLPRAPSPVATLWVAGAFALGATTSASAGHLRNRALEVAAFACVIAGVVLLVVAAVQLRRRGVLGGKPRAGSD